MVDSSLYEWVDTFATFLFVLQHEHEKHGPFVTLYMPWSSLHYERGIEPATLSEYATFDDMQNTVDVHVSPATVASSSSDRGGLISSINRALFCPVAAVLNALVRYDMKSITELCDYCVVPPSFLRDMACAISPKMT